MGCREVTENHEIDFNQWARADCDRDLRSYINPLRPNNDLSQTSLCNIKGLSVSEIMRIENMITQVQFY